MDSIHTEVVKSLKLRDARTTADESVLKYDREERGVRTAGTYQNRESRT